eukprot:m.67099 g.67099  ORF g.67099 m.67099 type:complete len:502 (-) comp12688_c1_seq1:148-1653(-)
MRVKKDDAFDEVLLDEEGAAQFEEDEDQAENEDDEMSPEELQALYKRLSLALNRSMPHPVSIDYVDILGVQRTKGWLVAKLAKPLFKAKTFAEALAAVSKVQKDLNALNLFSNVDVILREAQDKAAGPDALDVVVQVKERKLISGSTGVVVGNNEGSAKLKVSVRNLLGVADELSFSSARTSAGTNTFEASFTQPIAGDVRWPFFLSASQVAIEWPASAHAQVLRGASIGIRAPSALGKHTLEYACVWRRVAAIGDQASFAVREQAGDTLKCSLKHTLAFDVPMGTHTHHGVTGKVETEVAGCGLGGDVPFVKQSVESSVCLPLREGIDVALSARAGLLLPFAWRAPSLSLLSRPRLAQSNIVDRFFLGGPLDVRGFATRGLGPREGQDSLGGDAYWALGAHVYTPLPFTSIRRRIGDAIKLHFFATAGSLCALESDSNLPTRLVSVGQALTTRISSSVGIGLSASFQTFSLELNYCLPIHTTKGDLASPGLQFGVGFSFL